MGCVSDNVKPQVFYLNNKLICLQISNATYKTNSNLNNIRRFYLVE